MLRAGPRPNLPPSGAQGHPVPSTPPPARPLVSLRRAAPLLRQDAGGAHRGGARGLKGEQLTPF